MTKETSREYSAGFVVLTILVAGASILDVLTAWLFTVKHLPYYVAGLAALAGTLRGLGRITIARDWVTFFD